MDYDKAAALEERLDELDDKLIPQAREADAREAWEVGAAFNATAARTAALYPDAVDPQSALHQRMLEIEEDLRSAGDPLIADPRKPLRIAQMAARELSIAPRREGGSGAAPGNHAQSRPGAARMWMTAPLTGPGARRFTPPAPAYEQQIAAISTEEDYLAAKQALFGRR
jgi:hypothetical protein